MPTLLFLALCVVGFLLVWYVIGLMLLPWFTKYEASIHAELGECLGPTCNPTKPERYVGDRGEVRYRYVPLKNVDFETLKKKHILDEARWDSAWWLFKLLAIWPRIISNKSLDKYTSDAVRLKQLESEKAEEEARIQKYVYQLREEEALEFAKLEMKKD